MAAVVSRSGVVWHGLPERLEPAAMNQVGEKVPDRTRSQDRQNWVLLDRTAHSPAAFAEVAARLGIALQSLAHVARASLVSIPRKPRRTLGNIVHRFCGLPDHPLCRALALVGATASLRTGAGAAGLCHSALHRGTDLVCARSLTDQEGELHDHLELGHLVVLDHGLEFLDPHGLDIADRAGRALDRLPDRILKALRGPAREFDEFHHRHRSLPRMFKPDYGLPRTARRQPARNLPC